MAAIAVTNGIVFRVQIDQLARAVDELHLDVFAFGITTDFR